MLRIVPHTVPRVGRSYEHFPDGFKLHLLRMSLLHEPLHWRAKRDPKTEMLSLQFFLRKGVSLAYVGRNQNLEDLRGQMSTKVLA